jgi:hypothetical protein
MERQKIKGASVADLSSRLRQASVCEAARGTAPSQMSTVAAGSTLFSISIPSTCGVRQSARPRDR